MSKSLKKITFIVFFIPLLLTIAQCSGLLDSITDLALEGYDSLDNENNIESTISGVTEALADSVSSSTSAAASTVAALARNNLDTDRVSLLLRHHCDDATSYDEDFSCDNTAHTMSRTVTYTDCEVSEGNRDYIVNGSFVVDVANAGDGFCNAHTIDLANLVMGVEDAEDGHLNAVHEFGTGSDGLVKTFTNALDKNVTDYITAERTDTFTDPVDTNGDDLADEVTVTIVKTIHREREIDGTLTYEMDITASSTSFTAEDEDGNAITVTVTEPVHRITFDEDGAIESRIIQSGNLVVDHPTAGMRVVFSVGANGLTFDDEHCGPTDGALSLIAYELGDDGVVGQQIGEGTVTYEDGDVETAEYDGSVIYPEPRTCL